VESRRKKPEKPNHHIATGVKTPMKIATRVSKVGDPTKQPPHADLLG
jgi:hypothetical protein